MFHVQKLRSLGFAGAQLPGCFRFLDFLFFADEYLVGYFALRVVSEAVIKDVNRVDR